MAKEFPFRKQDEKALKDGGKVAQAQYYTTIQSTAKSILETASREPDSQSAREYMAGAVPKAAQEMAEEVGTSLDILRQSDNWLAFEEEFGGKPGDWGGGKYPSFVAIVNLAAFYAVHKDLMQVIEAEKPGTFSDLEPNLRTRRRRPNKRNLMPGGKYGG